MSGLTPTGRLFTRPVQLSNGSSACHMCSVGTFQVLTGAEAAAAAVTRQQQHAAAAQRLSQQQQERVPTPSLRCHSAHVAALHCCANGCVTASQAVLRTRDQLPETTHAWSLLMTWSVQVSRNTRVVACQLCILPVNNGSRHLSSILTPGDAPHQRREWSADLCECSDAC
jgi:alkylated DNA repair dioxygenase AlkB